MQAPFHCGATDYRERALAVFIESLVRGKHILYLGSDRHSIDLLSRGALSVDVLGDHLSAQPSMARVGCAGSASGRLPFDEAKFEVVVVPDVACLGTSLPESLDELRRVTGDNGELIVGAENGEAFEPSGPASVAPGPLLGYEELYRELTARFAVVRMLGQAPFRGYSIFDYSVQEELSDIGFDGTLVERENEIPDRFLALCAHHEVSIDPYLVVRVPGAIEPPSDSKRVDVHGGAEEEGRHEQEVRRLETALKGCVDKLGELRAEHERRGALLRDLVEQLGAAGPGPDAGLSRDAELGRAREERDTAMTRAEQAEAARRQAAERLDEVSSYLSTSALSPARAGEELDKSHATLLGTVRGMRSRIAELEESRDAAQARLMLAEHDISDVQERFRGSELALEEMRERFELELARTRVTASGEKGLPGADQAALRGECDGLRARSRDLDRTLQEILERDVSLSRISAAGLKEIETLRSSLAEFQLKESVLITRLSEAERKIEDERRESTALGLNRVDCDARVTSLEAELSKRAEELDLLRDSMEALTLERDQSNRELETALAAAEARAAEADARSKELEAALVEARGALADLAVSVGELGGEMIGPAGVSEADGIGSRSKSAAVDSLRFKLVQRDERIRSLEIQLRESNEFREEQGTMEYELDELRDEAARISAELRRQLDRREAVRTSLQALRQSMPSGERSQQLVEELLRLIESE